MAPVFAARIWPSWNAPMDFGFCWRGERLLGDHKTLRGLAAGTLVGGAVFLLQILIRRHGVGPLTAGTEFPSVDTAPYVGFWLGFCALVADAVKSFFKRRRGIRPGGSWMPFDKIDWVLGAWLGALPFYRFEPAFVATLLLAGFALSFASHFIGYLLRLNDEPL